MYLSDLCAALLDLPVIWLGAVWPFLRRWFSMAWLGVAGTTLSLAVFVCFRVDSSLCRFLSVAGLILSSRWNNWATAAKAAVVQRFTVAPAKNQPQAPSGKQHHFSGTPSLHVGMLVPQNEAQLSWRSSLCTFPATPCTTKSPTLEDMSRISSSLLQHVYVCGA